jgi:Fe-S oxidoreductase
LQQKAVLYAGCLMDFAYPEMGEAVVRVLNKAGVEVVFPEGQTCCGAPARHGGAYEVAGKNAVDNLDALLAEEADYVVSACPTCTVSLKKEFTSTLQSLGKTGELERAGKLAAKTVDFSTLVQRLVAEGRLAFKPGYDPGKLTYHDSCHYKRTLHAEAAPRALLTKAGGQISEMAESDMCCGMGGSYSLKMPEISAPMLERKLQNIEATGAATAVSDCPGCVMQIRGGFDQRGGKVQVLHTVQVLEQALA